jgi:hypothetical protein
MSYISRTVNIHPVHGVALPAFGGDVDDRVSMEFVPHYRHDGNGHTITLVLVEWFGSTRTEAVHETVTLADEDDVVNEMADMQWRADDHLQAFGVADPHSEGDWSRTLINIIDREKAAYAVAAE